MEAATTTETPRSIEGEKAQRIVDATRTCVAERGVAGATFDHVAREAGVSRGLLHYYFGTKERLLTEVVRRDCDLRMQLLEAQLAGAADADILLGLLRAQLEDFVTTEPGLVALIFELFTIARRNEEIAAEFAELLRRTSSHVAQLLAAKQAEGVLQLKADPEAIADVLFGLADGLAIRMISDPGRDWGPTVEAGVIAVRGLLTA
ncbi:HTH-type transcriptional regulator BetI [Paraconexibacter sp. AEG42_29]|uniref:HTH-type transcriptional regulator BetI n=1 Tax=Paraconexibacter sp. AEG42_29 TaxID=2997339 RepID=A0AAU7B0Q4_9ACTN